MIKNEKKATYFVGSKKVTHKKYIHYAMIQNILTLKDKYRNIEKLITELQNQISEQNKSCSELRLQMLQLQVQAKQWN